MAESHHCQCQELHINESDRCGNCRYGICSCCSYPNEIECHRHAPSLGGRDVYGSDRKAIWPLVRRSAICGDYERDSQRAATWKKEGDGWIIDTPAYP